MGGLIWPTKREGLTQKGKGKGTTNVGACSPYVCHISSFNLLSHLAKKKHSKVKMQTAAHSGQQ